MYLILVPASEIDIEITTRLGNVVLKQYFYWKTIVFTMIGYVSVHLAVF